MCEYRRIYSAGEFKRMPGNAFWVGLVLLLVATLYWPDTAALGRYWFDQDVNAQSGVLIALLSGVLIFRARAHLQRVPLGPVYWACFPFIACATASLICWRAGILTLQLLFLPAILWLAVLCVLGRQAARLVSFAIGFLYFAMPGWDLFGPALQRLTAWAIGVMGPVVGLPVAVSGTTAVLPGGLTFTVERACSGVDFLTVGLAVAALHGELAHANLRRRATLVVAMLLLAIFSNWVRVILIIAIGYGSQMRSALATQDHLALGWAVFACALLAFVWAATRLAPAESDAAITTGADDEGAARAPRYRRQTAWRFGIVATALLAVPLLVYGSLLSTEAQAYSAVLELPPGRPPWQGPGGAVDPLWQPKFVGAQAERRARYQRADGRIVEVVVIGFPKQTRGAQILDYRNSLLGDHGLAMGAITLGHGSGIPHSEVIALDPRGQRSVVWSVIEVGGSFFGAPLSSQLWYGARSLIGTPYSAYFALRAQCESSCELARAALTDFLRSNGPTLFSSLPDAGPKR